MAENADPLTPNRAFAIPTRGSDPGTWDIPVNGNMTMLDTILGAPTNIAVTDGTAVGLTMAQIVNGTITVTGALTAGATIGFPPGISGWWTIENRCSGTGPLVVSIGGGGEVIGMPPGITDILVSGSAPTASGATGAVRYRNLAPVGSYLDIASATIPSWITFSTIPPYLNCNGAAFNTTMYPALLSFLGGRATLPDFRGCTPAYLNQGVDNFDVTRSGLDGNTIFAFGGADSITLLAPAIPTITAAGSGTVAVAGTNPGFAVPVTIGGSVEEASLGSGGGFTVPIRAGGQPWNTLLVTQITSAGSASVTTTSNNTAGGPHVNTQPTRMSGLRLIRAA